MQQMKFKVCRITARGRVLARSRTFKEPDLSYVAADALRVPVSAVHAPWILYVSTKDKLGHQGRAELRRSPGEPLPNNFPADKLIW
jgi:hypothetical protein